MATVLMRGLDALFGHPRGVAGRLGGAIMARGNLEQERWAVRHAELRAGRRVLVIGYGPGVGVGLAAAAVAPGGHVVGVDPSKVMREMAARRCAEHIRAGVVDLRVGTVEDTGCADAEMDAAISVNNIMLWNRPVGFAELHRVLRPGGILVVTVHRHVLRARPEELRDEARTAGFGELGLTLRSRRFTSAAVELLARRDSG